MHGMNCDPKGGYYSTFEPVFIQQDKEFQFLTLLRGVEVDFNLIFF